MAIQDILVYVDASSHNQARLEAAVSMAKAQGSALTGLYVVNKPQIPEYIRAQMKPSFFERQQAAAMQAAVDAEKTFKDLTAAAGLETDWYVARGNQAEAISLHGRYADLVIIGQQDPEEAEKEGTEELPDRVVLSIGRPVLLLPYDGELETVGKHIAVAWDASRLAARAVSDALPFLQAADRVDILVVNAHGGAAGRGTAVGSAICKYLTRHGVDASAQHVYGDESDDGAKLHAHAVELGADMIVMGAYGHARWREVALGGVTQYMLRHTKVPVLMSH